MSWLDDADIAPCGRCGTDVVLEHDGVCPHGYAHCPGCGPEGVCPDCRHEAWAEAVRSGVYSAVADPLTTEPVETYGDYLARTANPRFCTTCNSYGCEHQKKGA